MPARTSGPPALRAAAKRSRCGTGGQAGRPRGTEHRHSATVYRASVPVTSLRTPLARWLRGRRRVRTNASMSGGCPLTHTQSAAARPPARRPECGLLGMCVRVQRQRGGWGRTGRHAASEALAVLTTSGTGSRRLLYRGISVLLCLPHPAFARSIARENSGKMAAPWLCAKSRERKPGQHGRAPVPALKPRRRR